MAAPRCERCRFWVMEKDQLKLHREDREGKCRARAPSPERDAYQYHITNLLSFLLWKQWDNDEKFPQWEEAEELAYWPLTTGGEWCGEFKAREKRNAKP
jgi:hypothetical protein